MRETGVGSESVPAVLCPPDILELFRVYRAILGMVNVRGAE